MSRSINKNMTIASMAIAILETNHFSYSDKQRDALVKRLQSVFNNECHAMEHSWGISHSHHETHNYFTKHDDIAIASAIDFAMRI